MYVVVQHGLAREACETFSLTSDHKDLLHVHLLDYCLIVRSSYNDAVRNPECMPSDYCLIVNR